MCGIAGLSLAADERCYPTKISAAMLRAIAHRGPDATGAAWVEPKSLEVWFQKEPVPASQFIPMLDLHGARTAILHTRYGTQGAKENNDNNHPIVLPGMVGIHNGMLRNDDALFALTGAERIGQVDSEAAFALLNHHDGTDTCTRLAMLEGSAALAWLTVDDEGLSDRVLHLARVTSSPLWVAQSNRGSFFFGSTRGTIEAAEKEMGQVFPFVQMIPEGTYMRIRRGCIIEWAIIPLPVRPEPKQSVWVGSKAKTHQPKAKNQNQKQTPKTKQQPLPDIADTFMGDDDGYWAWKHHKARRQEHAAAMQERRWTP